MKLTLTWKNFNVAPVSMAIYRGDAPLDPAALPAPLVTLTAGEETWVDPSVTRGQLYYYMFVTTGSTDKVPTRNYPIRAVPRRGHGPTDLLYGDYELGYFGSLTALEFATTVDLLKAIGFSGAEAAALAVAKGGMPTWHKFAYKGKILFITEGGISTSSMNWMQLAQKGAVYGTDTALPDFTTPKHGTVQNASITIGPDRYRVRLPRGTEGDPSVPSTQVAGNITTGNSEFDALCATMVMWVNINQKLPNVASLTPTNFGFASKAQGIMCQEVNVANLVLERGSTAASAASVSLASFALTLTNTGVFVPVLELVEN